jgi:hypothetical protein
MSAVSKVLDNRFLYQYILNYIPISDKTTKNRRCVVSALKHFHCEWSYHVPRCYICHRWHPCIIRRVGKRRMCDRCKNIVQSRLYYFFN